MGKMIFLCHSSKDKPFVRNLETCLRYCYFDCWLDERKLRVGDSIRGKIAEALQKCDFVIPVLSQNSIASEWVNQELNSVFSLEMEVGTKKILPVNLDLSNKEIPVFLKDRLFADFRGDKQNAITELVRAIEPNGFMHHFVRWHEYSLYDTDFPPYLLSLIGVIGETLDTEGYFLLKRPVLRTHGYEAELEHERITVDLEEAESAGAIKIVSMEAMEIEGKDYGELIIRGRLTKKGLGVFRRLSVAALV